MVGGAPSGHAASGIERAQALASARSKLCILSALPEIHSGGFGFPDAGGPRFPAGSPGRGILIRRPRTDRSRPSRRVCRRSGSRTTPKPFLVPTTKVKNPSRSVQGSFQRVAQRSRRSCSLWLMISGPDLGVVFGLECHAKALELAPARRCDWKALPLCTRHWSDPVENGWAPIVVTADSVAILVWPMPCAALHLRHIEPGGHIFRQADFFVDISMECPRRSSP